MIVGAWSIVLGRILTQCLASARNSAVMDTVKHPVPWKYSMVVHVHYTSLHQGLQYLIPGDLSQETVTMEEKNAICHKSILLGLISYSSNCPTEDKWSLMMTTLLTMKTM